MQIWSIWHACDPPDVLSVKAFFRDLAIRHSDRCPGSLPGQVDPFVPECGALLPSCATSFAVRGTCISATFTSRKKASCAARLALA